MSELLEQVRRAGWLVAETGLLIVVLCVLLSIILGPEESGAFVASVAENANAFLRGMPSGLIMGLALIVLAYGIVKSGLKR